MKKLQHRDDDPTYYIRCNGASIHINAVDLDAPRLDGEWGGEQCEGCGADLNETAIMPDWVGYGAAVKCGACAATYRVQVA